MEVRGFKISREEFAIQSEEALKELDVAISQPDKTPLQVFLTWDEYAQLIPALEKCRGDDEQGDFVFWDNRIELAGPEGFVDGGIYKGVQLFYTRAEAPASFKP